MITRVAIDSQALLDHNGPTRAALNTHRSLLQVLQSFGFIEFMGNADVTALFQAIERLDNGMRELWVERISELYIMNRVRFGSSSETTGDLCAREPLAEILRAMVDLVVISEGASTDREAVSVVGFETREGEPELTLADSIAHCRTITTARSLRELGNYRENTLRDVIWKEVFDVPARISIEATLLDQYFLKHLFDGKSRRKWDHVLWIIRRLDESMLPGSTVRLLCALPSDGRPPRPFTRSRIESMIQTHIAPILGSGHLSKIEFVLAPWPLRFESGPHNRHLRFNTGIAISTEEGFDRFDRSKIQGIDGFSWHGITSASLIEDLGRRESVIETHRNRVELQA